MGQFRNLGPGLLDLRRVFTAVGVQGGALGYFGVWGFGLETCAKRSLQATAQHL